MSAIGLGSNFCSWRHPVISLAALFARTKSSA